MRCILVGVASWFVLATSSVWGDVLLYRVPGTDLVFPLQGRVTVHPGRTVTLKHDRFGNLYFGLENIRYFEVPQTETLASRKVQQAVRAGSVSECLSVAKWCLHHGLLDQFYDCLGAAWRLDPKHPAVKRLAEMKRKIDAPVPVSREQEEEMRRYVKTSDSMRFARSKHFLMLHDTSPKEDPFSKKTRATERLELLETVYESFLMKFCVEGYSLGVPKEHLKVVLFADREDFLHFGEKSELSKAAGFYTKSKNTAVFYDQGTNEAYKILFELNGILQREKEKAIKGRWPGAKNLVRLANTIQLMLRVAKENADIEVVSHEATHQMAANTGLMPNNAPVPLWAAEGLATYFECPEQASWSGIGAVNKGRLEDYRLLAKYTDRSNVSFVSSDKVFKLAANHYTIKHAYGQAWALTHFLMERHFDGLIEYYRLLAEKKSEKQLSAEEYEELFQKAFGKDREALEAQWHKYMRSLKTDLELVLEGK